MIGFRDMSFCDAFPKRCSNSECPRAVTGEVREAARKWWGGDDFPLIMTDFYEPCTIKKPVEELKDDFLE